MLHNTATNTVVSLSSGFHFDKSGSHKTNIDNRKMITKINTEIIIDWNIGFMLIKNWFLKTNFFEVIAKVGNE